MGSRKKRYQNRLDIRRSKGDKHTGTHGDKSYRYGRHDELTDPNDLDRVATEYRREHDGIK